MNDYLVLDIGGSSIKYAWVNENEMKQQGNVKTPKKSMADFLDRIEEVFLPFEGKVSGVAISMPGLINSTTGYVVHGGALTYIQKVNMKEMLEERLSVSVEIENDGRCAALGEAWKGRLSGIKNGIVLALGTGVGGGLIVNGQLVKGARLGAGELSHIRTDGLDPLDTKKLFGYTGSTVRLVHHAAAALNENSETFSGQDLFNHLKNGDERVLQLFHRYCQQVAAQIMNLQSILDPEAIVIGGGMSEEPMLTEGIVQALEEYAEADHPIQIMGYKAKVLRSELGNDANIYGALSHFLSA